MGGLLEHVVMRKFIVTVLALGIYGCAEQPVSPAASTSPARPVGQQSRETVLQLVDDFFGRGAQGIADVVNRVLDDKGLPSAYIRGEEGGGAVGIGLTFGHGNIYLQDGTTSEVYWCSPSLGLDIGGNASKTFILIYNLPSLDALFQRFGGVDGSLYFVGGAGVNYNRHENIELASVRFGVGWRQGLNLGYVRLSPERLPFSC